LKFEEATAHIQREALFIPETSFVGVLLFSFGGGWRTVGCVPFNAAPHVGQLRLFSLTAVEQTGHLFIEPLL
jgi:hypothetical protein